VPTLTFPLSRIEGHAQVVIEVRGEPLSDDASPGQNSHVLSARFQATEFRGFEYLIQGIPAEQMVVIVPRICGVCSTAHHVAAVKTLEDVYGVTPPPLARTLRELLLLGQLVQNQATSLFMFTMPDRLGISSLFQLAQDPEAGDAQAPIAAGRIAAGRIAPRALQVRQAGTKLIKLAGGQFIHPIKAVVGGVTSGVGHQAATAMREEVSEVLPVACALFDEYWEMSLVLRERMGSWGDDSPACYISAVADSRPDYCGADICVLCPDGTVGDVFPARDFRTYLTYQETDYSYADKTSYGGRVMRANSLARINAARSMGTVRADEYLARFREAFGRPAHAIMLYDLARGIELVYALERAAEILGEPLDQGEVAVPYIPTDGEGFGLVEAPRGPLIHHYVIQEGRVAEGEFVIPTVHNVMAIERALRVAAERYVSADRIDMELEHAVGRVVRSFDPCIACATH
jgi:F420-non-reducing hydrogenase large subunit